jgi:hypothetical protein
VSVVGCCLLAATCWQLAAAWFWFAVCWMRVESIAYHYHNHIPRAFYFMSDVDVGDVGAVRQKKNPTCPPGDF